MKAKAVLPKKQGQALLKVSFGKRDIFDYATAAHIAQNTVRGLLPITFTAGEEHPDVFYKTTGLLSLEAFLANRLSLPQLQSLLQSVVTVLDTVATAGLAGENLIMDEGYVYVDEDAIAHFVYLPLNNAGIKERTVLDLLIHIVSHARFMTEESHVYAERALGYLEKQTMFSLAEIKLFLGVKPLTPCQAADHIGGLPLPDLSATVKPVWEPDFVSVASEDQTKIPPAPDDPSLSAAPPAPLLPAPDDPPPTVPAGSSQAYPEDPSPPAQDDLPPAPDDPSLSAAPPAPLPPAPDDPRPGASAGSSPPAPVIECPLPVLQSTHNSSLCLIRKSDNKSWELSGSKLLLGRSSSADIRISDSVAVSRQHALIFSDGDKLFIEDLGSVNGSFLNAQRLSPHQPVELSLGDELAISNIGFSIDFVHHDPAIRL
ncbi:MAG: FHA domain-containing protein [Actinomycetia bacterium]|nr:FHA domain-containing protein [Actinomycetes bacterium]